MAELDLRPVVDAYYVLSPMGLTARTMNVGAILSNSTLIDTKTRVVTVTNVQGLIDLGFSTDSLEYKAAQVYFGASSRPSKLAIIRVIMDNLSGYPTELKWSGQLSTGDVIKVDTESQTFQLATATTVSYIGTLTAGNTVTVDETVYTIVDEASETPNEFTVQGLVGELSSEYQGEFQELSPGQVSLIFRNTSAGANPPDHTITVAAGTGSAVEATVTAEGLAGNSTTIVSWLSTTMGADPATTTITPDGNGTIIFKNKENGKLEPERSLEVTNTDGNVGQITVKYGEPDALLEPIGTSLADARAKNSEWYSFTHLTNRGYEDLKAMADFAESANPVSFAFIWSADPEILTEEENTFATMYEAKYRHTAGIWHQDYTAAVGAMGYAMGQMKKTANSSFTLAMKTFPTVLTADLTASEVTKLEGYKANVYINRGGYNMYELGTQFSGDYSDEIIQLDNLVSEVSTSVANLITSRPKIPQTEAGMTTIKDVISSVLSTYVTQGLIAPGTWNGPSILDLQPGQFLSNGYLVLSEPIASQTTADRNARKAPPIYAIVKLAGAIHSVIIEVNVDR